MAERHPDVAQLSFLDDCHTIDRADAGIAAVQDLLAGCATANLVDVPEKGKVFSFNAEAAARVAAALGYQDRSQTGIKVVGSPFGQPEWVKQQCVQAADKACALVDTIMDLPALPKQHQLLLVRKCIQHKLCHLQPTVEHAHVAEAAAQLDGRVQGAVQRIVDVGEAQVPHTAKLQMSLPMCHGLDQVHARNFASDVPVVCGTNARSAARGGAATADLGRRTRRAAAAAVERTGARGGQHAGQRGVQRCSSVLVD